MKKIFRKIHLWLSVPFGIFITLICFSGAMMVFEKEITETCRHDLYFVKSVQEKPLPLNELMKAVTATLSDSVTVTGVTVSSDASRTYQVSLSQPRHASLYVDQYTGEIKGRNERLPFYDTMFRLHRWMMGSPQNFGKPLVGISTLLLVVILITGILMWLSNRHKPLTRSLTICCTKGWMRFCHDLHVAGGIYSTIFLLALALTGLTWSFSWYRNGFYRLCDVDENPVPGHHGKTGISRNIRPDFTQWQKVYELLAQKHPGYQQITLSDGSASIVPAGRYSLRSSDRYDFDTESGKITGNRPYSIQEKSVRINNSVYSIHVGNWGGPLTRFLTFLFALLGATLPLTGYYLWIKKLVNKRTHKDGKRKN